MEQTSKDPLHGKRLDAILEELVDYYNGFEELGKQINIRCFNENPSINSSLKFLRKTDWARKKVDYFTLFTFEILVFNPFFCLFCGLLIFNMY